jgi:hypothetical protein
MQSRNFVLYPNSSAMKLAVLSVRTNVFSLLAGCDHIVTTAERYRIDDLT